MNRVTDDLNNLTMPETAAERALREEREAAAALANQEVDFEDEDTQDEAQAIEHTRTLKMEYNPDEVEFWFMQIENEMFACGVKSQWLKRCVLVRNLPPKVQADVKSLLILKKSAAPPTLYKQIKNEILRIHAPKKEDTYKKALSRVLVGLPSQLGQQLIDDICDRPIKLEGCCCAKAVNTLWSLQLPVAVRSHIADLDFTAATYNSVFQTADKVFLSTRSTDVSASVAAVMAPQVKDTTQVAAISRPRRNNKNKNQQGSGSAAGGSSNSNSNNSSNASNSGGQGRGPKSNQNPPSSCCDNHYRWGSLAWFCLEPSSCPWVNKITAKPEKKNSNKN